MELDFQNSDNGWRWAGRTEVQCAILYICECCKSSLIKGLNTSLDHSHEKLPSVVLNVWYRSKIMSLKLFVGN